MAVLFSEKHIDLFSIYSSTGAYQRIPRIMYNVCLKIERSVTK